MVVSSNGFGRGTSIFQKFYEIKGFLQKNNQEFVILKVRGEGSNLKGFCKNIVANHLVEIFKDMLITGEDLDSWFDIPNVTIGEIKKSKKSILILVDNLFIKGFLSYKEDKPFIDDALAIADLKKKRNSFKKQSDD